MHKKLRFHWMFPKGGEVAMKTAQETSRVLTTKSKSPAALPDLDGWVRFARSAEEAAYVVFEEPAHEIDEVTHDAPLVIAETRVDVPEATVSDAVMMLDLRNTTALLFKNAGTGRHNMVYRRGDGSIGWVEPH